MEEKNYIKELNLKEMLHQILCHKKLYAIVLPLVFVLSCAYILCIPRFYRAEVRMAPETDAGAGLSSLTSLASTFGFDLGMGQSTDAISPELYPELFDSNDFMAGLMDMHVKTSDGAVSTDYYTYLTKHQKSAPWAPIKRWFKQLFKKKKPKQQQGTDATGSHINPFLMDEEQEALMQTVKSNVKCKIDKQTDVIIITVEDQDPLVCATMADSVRAHLQQFIIDYRTSKARVDVDYYRTLCENAEADYDKSVLAYSNYADSHQNVILQSFISKRDELENDMQVRFNTLTALRQQLQSAEAKVQERTPAFTVLQNASVPVKPAGPKRMIFVCATFILAFICVTLWAVRKELLAPLTRETPKS